MAKRMRGTNRGFRIQEFFRARTERAIVNGRVLPYLAGTILVIAMVAAVAIRLVDRADFPTYGDGLWWAVVTLGTVGYGDLVPHNSWGRAVGALVILFGVTSIAMLTSIVTSYFVTTKQQAGAVQPERQGDDDGVGGSPDTSRQILERLQAIEATLESLRRDDRP